MKPWRNSASLILAGRNGYKCNGTALAYNYNLLCLKRHQKSNFLPGRHVFPGGVTESSDADLKWYKLFARFGFEKDSFTSLMPNRTTQSYIFQSEKNELSREISLRITAIRETFEECGVLICRGRKSDTPVNWAPHISLPKNELQIWQNKIHEDATEFYKFCETFECYPDLWALYEWSNWLTPTSFYFKRYNTVFYLACMPDIPHAEYEAKEMQDLKWDTPENFLLHPKEIILPPPQMYEITQIAKYNNIDDLLEFAIKFNKVGSQLYFPVVANLKDGIVVMLHGDTMYPKEVNLEESQTIDRSDITIGEFLETTPVKHRMEFHQSGIRVVQSDYVKNIASHAEFTSRIISKVTSNL